VELESEIRTLYMLGKYSATKLWPIHRGLVISSSSFFFFWDRVSLSTCSPSWPQARNPASAYKVLELPGCTTTPIVTGPSDWREDITLSWLALKPCWMQDGHSLWKLFCSPAFPQTSCLPPPFWWQCMVGQGWNQHHKRTLSRMRRALPKSAREDMVRRCAVLRSHYKVQRVCSVRMCRMSYLLGHPHTLGDTLGGDLSEAHW
jgi:hypothetical protein